MKTILLAVVIAVSSASTIAATKAKLPAPTAKPACADNVCLKLHQAASVALVQARIDVILLREEEYQQRIPSAAEAMMEKTKMARQEIAPLYSEALKSAVSSPSTASALKNYMKIWTAAINAYPMQTVKSTPEREAEHKGYEARLNDAWAEVQIEAGI